MKLTCKECRFYKHGRFPIVGECEIDMEGKTIHDGCNRGEPQFPDKPIPKQGQ